MIPNMSTIHIQSKSHQREKGVFLFGLSMFGSYSTCDPDRSHVSYLSLQVLRNKRIN
uniref:Uncharacterized protein n=1 Tax=Arundo donax TaxID=35708 RepID=A0A0A9AAR0_ARUDO